MPIWSAEIKELESLYESFKGKVPELEKELLHLINTEDENVALLYSRRCLEVIITDLCECELERERGSEPLKGIIDKLYKEKKIPAHIIASMHGLNEVSTFGTHPKDFDPVQVKPVLVNLDIIIKWYLKYKDKQAISRKKTEEVEDETKISDNTTEKIQKSNKKLIGLISGAALIVVIFSALFVFNIIGVGSQNREPEKSIAVLPFQNDSPEVSEETTNFINGLMDELISNLQRIKELRVLGRNSVEQYRNNMSKSNPDIARQLGVTYIVEGSGQKYGNSFSLRVRLINAKGKEALIWTKSYEQEIKGTEDIFAVPSQISQTIAYELKTVISPEEKLLIEKTSTTNIEALYFYQQGNEEYRKYMINNSDKEALLKAELYYRKALNYDSTFARAYTGLAGVYWGKHFIEEYLTQDFMDSVLIYSNIALGYDDHIAEAYLLRGDYHRERIESKQALEEYDKALNINPNFWQAYSSRASLYYLTGDYDKAYEDAILAIKLNRGPELPVSLLTLGLPAMHYGFFNEAKYFLDEVLKLNGDSAFYLYYLGMLEMYQENFGKAIEYSERSYFLDSTQTELLQNLGNFYWVTGQKETALDYYNKYISRSESFKSKLWFEEKTHSIQAVHRLGYCYWITGHKDKAELYFDEQKRICEESIKLNREYGAKAYYDLAGIYALRGEKEKAYENLHLYVKESGENHTYAMIWYLKYDPFFDSIRNEPEFQDILAERKAKYQESHEKLRKWLEDQGII